MKKTSLIIMAVVFFLAIPAVTHAFSVKTENSVNIDKNEVIDGNLFAVGNNISVDGKVKGDIFCAGQSININGEVEGDVICAGQMININGKVGGNVRVLGNSTTISSEVSRSVMAAGASINLDQSANIGWDAYLAGASINTKGKIGRDLNCAGSDINIAGEVGKNVKANLDQSNKERLSQTSHLVISKGAIINGNLSYYDYQNANIDKEAQVKGSTEKKEPKWTAKKERTAGDWLFGELYSIFAALVIGLVIISLWKKETIEIINTIKTKPVQTIGWGAVVLFITPIISLILIFTLIGIPLAFIMLLIWIIGLIVAKVFTGILVGRYIIENTWKEKKENIFIIMIGGIIITWLIFSVPFIGWVFYLAALLWGLGGIFVLLKKV
jgi:hypothetical protein